MGNMKKTTIYDIAAALGVSSASVHRALSNHSGVNPTRRKRILQAAEAMGYRPNLAARYLATKRNLVVGVVTPREIASFYDRVRTGIVEESEPFRMAGLQIQQFTFPRLGIDEVEAFEAALAAKVDGIIVVPGSQEQIAPLIRRASHAGIPVLCLTNDCRSKEKLTTVSVDTIASGALVGELLGRFLGPVRGAAKIAMTTADMAVADHADRYEAFRNALAALFPSFQLFPAIENHESEVEAYEKTLSFLSEHPDLSGLYVSTGNGAPIFRALHKAGLAGKVTVIATNLFPELAAEMEAGNVAAAVYSRPHSQGRIAFRTMHEYLVENKVPPTRLLLDPILVTKSTLRRTMSRMMRVSVHSSLKERARQAARASESVIDDY
jgi:LacI family transcriptional regulator